MRNSNPKKETTSVTAEDFDLEIKANKIALNKALRDRAALNSRIQRFRKRIDYLNILSPRQKKLDV